MPRDTHKPSPRYPFASGTRQGPMVPGRSVAAGPRQGPMVPGPRAHGMAGSLVKGPMVPGPRAYGMAGARVARGYGTQAKRPGMYGPGMTHVPSVRPGHPVAGGVPSVRPGHPTGVFAAGKGGGMAAGKRARKVRGFGHPNVAGLDKRSAVKLQIAAMRKAKGKRRGRAIAAGGCTRNVNMASFPCQGAM